MHLRFGAEHVVGAKQCSVREPTEGRSQRDRVARSATQYIRCEGSPAQARDLGASGFVDLVPGPFGTSLLFGCPKPTRGCEAKQPAAWDVTTLLKFIERCVPDRPSLQVLYCAYMCSFAAPNPACAKRKQQANFAKRRKPCLGRWFGPRSPHCS